MKKILILTFTLSHLFALAQPESGERRDEIEAQRIAFITRELSLSPDEAKTFWPVYNQYREEQEIIRKNRTPELMSPRADYSRFSEAELNKFIQAELDYRQRELDLSKKYTEEFKRILPVKKVVQLYRAEQLFKVYLLKELRGDRHDLPRN
jgi:hypothetical protein